MNVLQAGQQLDIDGQLIAANGRSRLVMQGDGNLVLYRTDTGEARWASNTPGTPANRAVMQGDGNFVVYTQMGAVWASNTDGNPGAWVVLQDDGNLVVYSSAGAALWDSRTATDWSILTARSGDTHLATARWMSSTATMSPDGTIRGTTRIWCRWALRGFTGSVVPALFDKDGRVLWPLDVGSEKHQYGVDGTHVPFKDSDRTENWQNKVPQSVVASGTIARLGLVHFLDPKNRLLDDLKIVGEVIDVVVKIVREILVATGKDGEAPGDGAGVTIG
ncbi:MAG: hypothetical protein L0K86_25095 [Actinomycetia bacterium]|nr:hypothetical protein [Actinomycetes bacterium]